jgi:hypothetical protein
MIQNPEADRLRENVNLALNGFEACKKVFDQIAAGEIGPEMGWVGSMHCDIAIALISDPKD